jgi:hypothetical protein
MTKLELAIRRVSDLRDFYMKIKTNKATKNHSTGTTSRPVRPAKSPDKRLH